MYKDKVTVYIIVRLGPGTQNGKEVDSRTDILILLCLDSSVVNRKPIPREQNEVSEINVTLKNARFLLYHYSGIPP